MTEPKAEGHQSTGMFVTRGVRLRIPAGGLRISFQGDKPEMLPVTVEFGLDMCPFWIEIALRHLIEAEGHRQAAAEALSRGDEKGLGRALEAEFLAGMQAVVAAATAIDALYASVKREVPVPRELEESWRRNGTARYKQVVQVLCRAFRLKRQGVANLHSTLRQVYRFRGLAVHPPSEFSSPVLHPHAQRGTERRFISFGFDNAQQVVWAAVAIVTQLAEKGLTVESEGLRQMCEGLHALVERSRVAWEDRYGELAHVPQGA